MHHAEPVVLLLVLVAGLVILANKLKVSFPRGGDSAGAGRVLRPHRATHVCAGKGDNSSCVITTPIYQRLQHGALRMERQTIIAL